MNDRWRRVEILFHAAKEQAPEARHSFLERHCADAELRREVESLLAKDAESAGPLDGHAWEHAELTDEHSDGVLASGERLGPYEISGTLGTGGMGRVYRAEDLRLGRPVAIKVSRDRFTERFEREARAIAALNHPNICTLYDVGPNYLVMELVEGVTLADRLKEGPLPVPEAFLLARQIVEALTAAHEKGVIHRDLKPANITITPDGRIKVLDFGLAKAVESPIPGVQSLSDAPAGALSLSTPGMILGTASYMSPEQAKGQAVDKRSDIFAFGVVLYEMLTGRRTFDGDSVADTLGAVLKTEPDWKQLPPGLPSNVHSLLHSCLEKDVKNRRRDASDVRLEIDAIIASQTPLAVNRAERISTSKRAYIAGALAILAIAVLTSFWKTAAVPALPLVVMMDSPNPALVYDEETIAANGTNADVISDILADLPVRKQKETVGTEWHRDEELLKFRPDLIIIHFSAFDPSRGFVPKDRFKILVKFLSDAPTKLLIYSRRPGTALRNQVDTLLTDLYKEHPLLKQRVFTFSVSDYEPRWRSRVTGSQLKLAVKDILKLQ
jgi:predicted Ser/Thr protein kinase